jgi:hypothetical protein
VGNVTEVDQLLEVIGDVGAMVTAAECQLANGQLFLADVKQDQRLDIVDVADARAVQFSLDNFKTATVKTLNGSDGV